MSSGAFLLKRLFNILDGQLASAAGLILLLAMPLCSFGQQKDTRASEQARLAVPSSTPVEDVIRIDTDLIAVDVRVTDRNGRPVRNLKSEDFKLYEDGSERPISFFNIERKEGEQQPLAAKIQTKTMSRNFIGLVLGMGNR